MSVGKKSSVTIDHEDIIHIDVDALIWDKNLVDGAISDVDNVNVTDV